MDRLLSEQEVKKWLERWIGYLDEDMIYRMKIGTRDIPSAEPKTVKSCETCKHDEPFGCPSFIHDRCENYSEWEQADGEKTCGTCRNEDTYHCAECENKSDYEQAQADGEYILKSEAIRVASGYCHPSNIAKELEKLPSVAIPNKVGHWEYNQYDGNPNIGNWHCSECRNIVSDMPTCMGKPLYEFCPNCGCPMEIKGMSEVIFTAKEVESMMQECAFKLVAKVLDKLRAEIEQIADEEQKHDEKWAIGLQYAVKIIDKYRNEVSE